MIRALVSLSAIFSNLETKESFSNLETKEWSEKGTWQREYWNGLGRLSASPKVPMIFMDGRPQGLLKPPCLAFPLIKNNQKGLDWSEKSMAGKASSTRRSNSPCSLGDHRVNYWSLGFCLRAEEKKNYIDMCGKISWLSQYFRNGNRPSSTVLLRILLV